MKKVYLSIVALLFFASSCKQDTTTPPPPDTDNDSIPTVQLQNCDSLRWSWLQELTSFAPVIFAENETDTTSKAYFVLAYPTDPGKLVFWGVKLTSANKVVEVGVDESEQSLISQGYTDVQSLQEIPGYPGYYKQHVHWNLTGITPVTKVEVVVRTMGGNPKGKGTLLTERVFVPIALPPLTVGTHSENSNTDGL